MRSFHGGVGCVVAFLRPLTVDSYEAPGVLEELLTRAAADVIVQLSAAPALQRCSPAPVSCPGKSTDD